MKFKLHWILQAFYRSSYILIVWKAYYLDPVVPLNTVSVGQGRLRVLGIENISKFTTVERDRGLDIIELVVFHIQCIQNGVECHRLSGPDQHE